MKWGPKTGWKQGDCTDNSKVTWWHLKNKLYNLNWEKGVEIFIWSCCERELKTAIWIKGVRSLVVMSHNRGSWAHCTPPSTLLLPTFLFSHASWGHSLISFEAQLPHVRRGWKIFHTYLKVAWGSFSIVRWIPGKP